MGVFVCREELFMILRDIVSLSYTILRSSSEIIFGHSDNSDTPQSNNNNDYMITHGYNQGDKIFTKMYVKKKRVIETNKQ